MDFTLTIKLDKAAQAAVERIAEAIEKQTGCGGCAPPEPPEAAAEELLKKMEAEKKAEPKPEPEPKKEKPAPKKEPEPEPEAQTYTQEDIRSAIIQYHGGVAEKRARVKKLLGEFSETGKLADLDSSKYVDFIAALGEADES